MTTKKQDRAVFGLALREGGRRIPVKPRKRGSHKSARTTRLTVSLPTELINRVRDTVYWTPRLTVTRLVEESIRSSLAQMEATNCGPFPARTQELKPGRPRQTDRLHHPPTLTASEFMNGAPAGTAHVRPLMPMKRKEAGREYPI